MMANYTMTISQIIDSELIPNLFPTDYDFYVDDEQAKADFESKFIEHYYYREIGFETPFMFTQRLHSLLKLRMPYWKQLYETELEAKRINFLLNKDLKETFLREIDSENSLSGSHTVSGEDTSSQTSSSNSSMTQSGTTSNTNKQSLLNDGVSQASLSDGYLTGVASDNGTNSTNGTGESTDTTQLTSNNSQSSSSSQSGNESSTERTELISQGNIGVTSSAQLLKEWRDVLINMDEIIIKECEKLFMKIY